VGHEVSRQEAGFDARLVRRMALEGRCLLKGYLFENCGKQTGVWVGNMI